jgi:hypothetical protein
MPNALQLNQVIALVKGEKPRAETALTKAYHDIQKVEPLSGISRTYRPKDEDGDQYPSEGNLVQVSVTELINKAAEGLTRLFDLTATLEGGNTLAKADVVVDGNVLLPNVPVTYLLFLEKKMTDLVTFISKLPVLDPSQKWTFDDATNTYRSVSTETVKSKKIPRNHVKAAATDKHPAQVELYYEDVVVGYWTTTRFSGALEQKRVDELLARAKKLQDAVKLAREKANSIEITDAKVGDKFFGYLFSTNGSL